VSQTVLFKIEGSVAWATLNRPEVMNAINPEMLETLIDIAGKVATYQQIRVLVLTGNGKAFSSGGDIKAFHHMDEAAFQKFIQQLSRLSEAIHTLNKPVIAAINGYALAGGFELALMCDLRVASSSAKFGLPDTPLGLSPTSGMTYLLPRVVGLGRALHLVLDGEPIDADQAERMGLVTGVFPDKDLLGEAGKLAKKLASFPELAMTFGKQSLRAACNSDLATALAVEERNELACFGTQETRQRIAKFAKPR